MDGRSIIVLLFVLFAFGAKAQDTTAVYDSLYAQELGADDYGMRSYVMAFLKAGPNQDQSKEEAQQLQAAHVANIGRLAEEGKFVLTGPFLEGGELRGIYILQ